ncbi:hypothetical protein, partial [Staphylococcus condimenti]|uniref:hypothetical protein n=1 Tax=Staphylococcus condimenti TaxID=70255 RepID=UPI001F5E1DCB
MALSNAFCTALSSVSAGSKLFKASAVLIAWSSATLSAFSFHASLASLIALASCFNSSGVLFASAFAV